LFGASGLALMFDRIGQITKDPDMKETAEFWYQEILKYDYTTDGFTGLASGFSQRYKPTNLAFSNGITGIGCGLIKGLNPDRVNFDDLIWLL
jgi:hypothetical protein